MLLANTDDSELLNNSEPEIRVRLGIGSLTILMVGQSNQEAYCPSTGLTGGNIAFTAAGPSGCLVRSQCTIAQDPTTWQYFGAFGDAGGNGSLSPPATYGTASPHKSLGGGVLDAFGSECVMTRDLVAGSTGINHIEKFTIGGASLTTHFGPSANFPTSPGGTPTYWQQCLTFIAGATAGSTYQAIDWYQGESDCADTTRANAWYGLFSTVIAGLRTACNSSTTIPVIMSLLPSGSTPSGMPQLAILRASQQLAVDTLPGMTLINNDDCAFISDNIHMDADSQVNAGHRKAAAIAAALIQTTMSVTLLDSPDPVITSSALTYTSVVTNTGSNSASNVCLQVTLPTGVVFISGSGTGWTVTQSGQVIFCKRASMSTGAAPTITLNCTSPGAIGGGTITATASVVASNVMAASTASQTTTLQLPAAFKDTLQDTFMPLSQAEFSALGLTPPNTAIHLCQETSGNLADATGNGKTFTPTGSPSYNTAVSGSSLLGVSCTDLGGSFSYSNGPNATLTSVAVLVMVNITAGPAATRDLIAMFPSSTMSIRVTATPRFGCHLGGSAPSGTFSPVGYGPALLVYNKTATTAALYTLNEKIIPTWSAETNALMKILGGNAATITRVYEWEGSAAEAVAGNSTLAKNLLTTLGNGHWSPPWS